MIRAVSVRRSARVTGAEIAGRGPDRVQGGEGCRERRRARSAPNALPARAVQQQRGRRRDVASRIRRAYARTLRWTSRSSGARPGHLASRTSSLPLLAHRESPVRTRASSRRGAGRSSRAIPRTSARDPVVTNLEERAWRTAIPNRLRISRSLRGALRECSPFECAT